MDVRSSGSVTPDGDDEFFSTDRISSNSGAVELPADGFESFLLDTQDPLLTRYRDQPFREYSRDRVQPSFVQDLLASWDALYREPFRGVTSNGVVQEALYKLPPHGSAIPALQERAQDLLDCLTPEQVDRFRYPLDAHEWRAWSNPEFLIYPVGLRLEELPEPAVSAFMELLRASLSNEGYELVTTLMELNGYLGHLVDLPTVMNARSYSVSLFGEPSGERPWGWQLFGHHIALNFVVVGGRTVLAPVFLGAEPALTSEGGTSVFEAREAAAIALASSFSAKQRSSGVVFDSVLDPAMPDGRLHPADERHVAGAFRDNRVVPYEGVSVATFSPSQRELLNTIVADFLILLPESDCAATLAEAQSHFDETWFAWYGATDGTQPFYFRIHSPVLLAELDHHAGVWLTNRLPARFHVHTTLRLPNGNDYARAYIDQWRMRRGESTQNPWGASA